MVVLKSAPTHRLKSQLTTCARRRRPPRHLLRRLRATRDGAIVLPSAVRRLTPRTKARRPPRQHDPLDHPPPTPATPLAFPVINQVLGAVLARRVVGVHEIPQ